jgi:hypothetical protein
MACEVVAGRPRQLQSDPFHDGCDRLFLARTKLHDQCTAWGQQCGSLVRDDSVAIEPIGSAVERQRGIVIAHVGRKACDIATRNVRRIR